MTFVSYAQNFEDVMLWRALRQVEHGFYIDAGAYLPDIDSVTRAFSERGWRGINIEPHPTFLAALEAARPEDVNLGIAVGDVEGTVTFHGFANTGLATANPTYAEMHIENGRAPDRMEVRCRKLASVWDEHVPAGQPVHFLKVDVEGQEAAVLRGVDWSRQRPWVVVVEATLPMTQIPTHDAWHGILEAAGYRFVYWDGLNRFYLASEHEELAAHFASPPNVFDQFVCGTAARELAALKPDLKAARDGLDLARQKQVELAQQFDAATQALTRLTVERDEIQRRLDESLRARAGLSEDAARLRAALEQAAAEAEATGGHRDYLLRRGFWESLLFHRSGKPKKLVRTLMFHKSGKPRGVVRRWIVHRDGTPRQAFAMWMASPAYQALRYPAGRKAQQAPMETQGPTDLSPRARHFLTRLEASRVRRMDV